VHDLRRRENASCRRPRRSGLVEGGPAAVLAAESLRTSFFASVHQTPCLLRLSSPSPGHRRRRGVRLLLDGRGITRTSVIVAASRAADRLCRSSTGARRRHLHAGLDPLLKDAPPRSAASGCPVADLRVCQCCFLTAPVPSSIPCFWSTWLLDLGEGRLSTSTRRDLDAHRSASTRVGLWTARDRRLFIGLVPVFPCFSERTTPAA